MGIRRGKKFKGQTRKHPARPATPKKTRASRIRLLQSEQKFLQAQIISVATLEQRRIGLELHDGVQQELTGLSLMAQTLTESLRTSGCPQAELAAKLATGITRTHRRVRTLAKGLVPAEVNAGNLMAALTELAAHTTQSHGLACRFECAQPVRITDDLTAAHLYLIAQEAVNNAVKHARAKAVAIRLKQAGANLRLAVQDDGVGIDAAAPAAPAAGLGLRIMKYRCTLIGGELTIEGSSRAGTQVACVVPQASI